MDMHKNNRATTEHTFHVIVLVGIVLLERMGGRERVNLSSETSFCADSNELLFVSIALTLMEISVDCDRVK